jgi:hypothetical protein
MPTPEENQLTPGQGLPSAVLFGDDDPRLEILRKAPSETLIGLVGEIVTPSLGCSVAFFALGMSAEFRTTHPPVFLELIFAVLRERLPNAELSHEEGEIKP